MIEIFENQAAAVFTFFQKWNLSQDRYFKLLRTVTSQLKSLMQAGGKNYIFAVT